VNRSLRESLEFTGLDLARRIVPLFDHPATGSLARFLGALVCAFDSRGRRVALANIEAAFPGKYPSTAKAAIARQSYQTFARTMLELFWAPNITDAFVRRTIEFQGVREAVEGLEPGRPSIYCCLHYGNFEWLSLLSGWTDANGPVIAQRFRNPLIGPVFDSLRATTGNSVIPQERAMIRMLKHLRAGGKFGMLVDLNIDPREGAVAVRMFDGLVCSSTPAHASLACRTSARIIPVECRPLPGGGHRIIHHTPIDCDGGSDPADIAQRCWDTLEPAVRKLPGAWLWPYKHWRYRPEDDGGRYPFYANRNRRFDDLLRKSRTAVG
jgi:Kdo2-lipid IVA lauroyltransferase/acyltransferase